MAAASMDNGIKTAFFKRYLLIGFEIFFPPQS
jgi:hypothetical protein